MIQCQPVANSRAAVVADKREPLEAECRHDFDLIESQRTLRIVDVVVAAFWLGAVPAAAQVGHDDGEIPSQFRRALAPLVLCLRIALTLSANVRLCARYRRRFVEHKLTFGVEDGVVLTSTERFVETNGVQLRVIEAGDRGAPVVVLAHGFPELAYSWRHQIPALAEAGYHVLAPDQRGYGGSSKPEAVDAYNVVELSADIVGLLDDVDAERAVLVGHDFGGVVAWTAPLLHPDRFAGIAGLSVPPVPRSRVPTTQAFRKVFGDNFFYILYFQEPGPADAELNRDPATTLRRLMGSLGSGDEAAALRMLAPGAEGFIDRIPEPGGLPEWISQDEFDHYVAEFTHSGFTAPLNWYRCFDLNWELTAATPAATISVPSLFIGGAADPTLAYTPRHRVREVASGDYREVMIDGAGHWLQQERPREVNETLLDFLSRLEIR